MLNMARGLSYYLKNAWKNMPRADMQSRLIKWREGNSVVKVDKPLRLDRARALGYKAKRGFIVLRVRLRRGGRTRTFHKKGRKSGKQTIRKTLKMSYQWVAEIRAGKKHSNLEVLNSYNIGKDGKYYFFEVIMVDPNAPEIKNDRTMKWIASGTHRGRAERGLTSAGKKSRGFGGKSGKSPTKKVRPSLRAWNRRGK